ncbi:hypothetical protein KR018_006536 [Drosophila ironensis]|nr:hypothetical protein KR018_006536 [Drosophila ironensis]
MLFLHLLVWWTISQDFLWIITAQVEANITETHTPRIKMARKLSALSPSLDKDVQKRRFKKYQSTSMKTNASNAKVFSANTDKKENPNVSPTAIIGLVAVCLGFLAFAGYLRYEYKHRSSFNT